MSTSTQKISKEDAELLLQKETAIIKDLQTADDKERGYKKKKILELKEVTLKRLEYGLLPIKEKKNLSSYIWNNVLVKYGITYSKGHFSELFNETEKQIEKNPNGTNFDVTDGGHQWDKTITTDDGLIEIQNCLDCDAKLVNGIIYNPEQPKEESTGEAKTDIKINETWTSSEEQSAEVPDIMKHEVTRVLEKIKFAVKSLVENIEETQEKYMIAIRPVIEEEGADKEKIRDEKAQRKEMMKIFDDVFTEQFIADLDKFADENIIEQKHLKNLLDWRLRIGRYEKLIAKMMMKGDSFIHEVAKKLHCSAKHMKNDVLNIDIEKDLSKFKACPVCKADIAELINKELVKADYEENKERMFPK